MENRNIDFTGSNINYKIYGNGKPVVLIHGFGEDSSIWDEQVKALQQKNMLIVPDLPGTGTSEMLQKENVQISDFAAVIKVILDKEAIENAVLIGHSMGGYVTLAFAEKHPDAVTAFGLVHSGAYADDEEKIATRRKGIKFINENGSEAFLKTSTPGLFYNTEKSKPDIEILVKKGSSFSPDALISYYEAMISRSDTTAVLKSFNKSILFIIGEHDKAIPFPHSLQQSHMPAYASVNILRDSAHMGMLEEKEKMTEILGEFLQSV